MDWSNWWAVEYSSGPSIDLKYLEQIQNYYKAFYDLNIPIDFVCPSDELSKYDIVIGPVLYMISDEVVENIERFVNQGGTFITTFFSGIVDENDLVRLGGYPGAFRKLLGIWVEETDALFPDMNNEIIIEEEYKVLGDVYSCKLICDIVHTEGAKVIARYGKDYYANYPCITENIYGKGKAIYIASEPEEALLKTLMKHYCDEHQIESIIEPIEGVEVSERKKGDKTYLFLLNHNEKPTTVELPGEEYKNLLNNQTIQKKVELSRKGVAILEC